MGLKVLLILAVSLSTFVGLNARTVMCEGRTAEIPPLTKDIHALHLRDVGADNLYALHFPATLEDLNLSANGLMLLPNEFIPSKIKRLWLADNRLVTLPQEASAWTQLIYLNVDRNLLDSLPNLEQTKLRWLRANGNQLSVLPNLPDTIERLYLADNRLTQFTTKPKALRQLTLANNPIQSVEASLGEGLEELDLSGTKITRLPECLDGWRTLRVLNVARCPLLEEEKDRLDAFFDPLKTLVIF